LAVDNRLLNAPEGTNGWPIRSMSRVGYDGQFNPERIPAIRQDVRELSEVREYLSRKGPKASAIHPWGKLFLSGEARDQKTAEEDALTKCNSDPGRKGADGSCFLYAVQNHVVLPLRLTKPRAPAKDISEAIRLVIQMRADSSYRSAKDFKALAVEPISGWWITWQGASKIENAEHHVLAACQIANSRPCILLARGDSLVAPDPFSAPLRDIELTHYAGKYAIEKLPFTASVSSNITNNYASLPEPKAIAIKAFPTRYVSATGETSAIAQKNALDECNRIQGVPCLLYAIGDSVVLDKRKLTSDP
jgi:hypothetical protein